MNRSTGPTGTAPSSRGWGWAAHLRAGGTTPWSEWTEPGPADAGADALPGAEQLELLRRLNLEGRPGPTLVRRALTTSAPGRGRRDVPLVGDGAPPAYGVGPVDPGDLTATELLRTACLLLAEDLVSADAAGETRPSPVPGPRRWWWRQRYRLSGDRWATGPLREELLRQGYPQGGRDHIVYVVARRFDQVLTDAWTVRCFGQGPVYWEAWLEQARRRGGVGPRADLLGMAREWRHRVGPERVAVVMGLERIPALLRVRGLPAAALEPPTLSASAVELARNVGLLLGLLVRPEQRAVLLRRGLRPRLARHGLAGPGQPALGVPAEFRDWVREQAERQRDGLRADGYAVHGDLDELVPPADPAPDRGMAPMLGSVGDSRGDASGVPDVAHVLTLALRLLVEGGGRS